ncbi:hypothetical protein [Flavobacterium sp.]|uniref:hypothetical protein n=1 Tax=Flavobacterium sp. TaxID=239 RepID=UPI003D126BC7
MKKWLFLFFIWSCLKGYSQEKLEFKIQNILRVEDEFKTVFNYKVNYTIRNISKSKLSFFLNRSRISNHLNSALTNTIFYKMYKNDTLINAQVFDVRPELNSIEQQKLMIQILEEINGKKESKKSPEQLLIEFEKKKKENLKSEIITLEPNEILTFQNNLIWNKVRTVVNDDDIFYLDPKSKYTIDFSLVLLKKPFEKYFENEIEKKLILDENFIEGNFFSSKIEISLD